MVVVLSAQNAGRKRCLNPGPLHATDAATAEVCQVVECRRREVKVGLFAAFTSVGDGNSHGLPFDWKEDVEERTENCGNKLTCSPNLAITDRVVVGVSALVSPTWEFSNPFHHQRSSLREIVKEKMRHGADVVCIRVHNTTSTETSCVEQIEKLTREANEWFTHYHRRYLDQSVFQT